MIEINTTGSIDVPVSQKETGNDLLRLCAGGCGNKILFFGFPETEDWSESVIGALCVQ